VLAYLLSEKHYNNKYKAGQNFVDQLRRYVSNELIPRFNILDIERAYSEFCFRNAHTYVRLRI
jgi:hypothetical protein